MATPPPPAGKRRPWSVQLGSVAGALGWVLVATISLLAGLAMCAVLVAHGQHSRPQTSLGLIFAVALLPTFGAPLLIAAWRAGGDSRALRTTLTWLPAPWNLCSLALMSFFLPDFVGTALRSGSESAPVGLGLGPADAAPVAAFGHAAAERVDPGGEKDLRPDPPATFVDNEHRFSVPLPERSSAIYVDVKLRGPGGEQGARYIYDTGASYTSITTEMAQRLGLEFPADAPTISFNTANGPQTRKMIYLPTLVLGETEIPGLLVSVCDSCATDTSQGLLGLNVIREFDFRLVDQPHELQLAPHRTEGRPNRAYDIRPAIELEVEGSTGLWLGRVHWTLLLKNRSSVPIESIVPAITFHTAEGDRVLYGERIKRIEAGGEGRSRVQGRVFKEQDRGSAEFSWGLAEAYW